MGTFLLLFPDGSCWSHLHRFSLTQSLPASQTSQTSQNEGQVLGVLHAISQDTTWRTILTIRTPPLFLTLRLCSCA